MFSCCQQALSVQEERTWPPAALTLGWESAGMTLLWDMGWILVCSMHCFILGQVLLGEFSPQQSAKSQGSSEIVKEYF